MSVVEQSSVNLRNVLGVRDGDVGFAASAASRQSYSGLTLEDILMREKLHGPQPAATPTPAPAPSRTLLDIIRNEEPNPGSCRELIAGQNRDKKSWKSLKDKLWLRLGGGGAGAGWTSWTSTPASEFSVDYCGPPVSGGNSVSARFDSIAVVSDEPTPAVTNSEDTVVAGNDNDRGEIRRERTSVRFGMLVPISTESTQSENTQAEVPPSENARNNSARFESPPAELYGSPIGSDNSRNSVGSNASEQNTTRRRPDNTARDATHSEMEQAHEPTRQLSVVLALERELSERESEAARGAAEAASTPITALAPESEGTETGARMSLMDLLEEAEGQHVGLMGGQWCVLGDENAEEEKDSGGDNTCCVCMVRRKGAAFIPCGHTFCRLCSRELWVSRGACPLCNVSIQEVLDIF